MSIRQNHEIERRRSAGGKKRSSSAKRRRGSRRLQVEFLEERRLLTCQSLATGLVPADLITNLPGTGVTVLEGEEIAAAEMTGDGETLVKLVNKYKDEEFPLTGDATNMNLWLFLAVLGVAGAIAPFALRKREEIND